MGQKGKKNTYTTAAARFMFWTPAYKYYCKRGQNAWGEVQLLQFFLIRFPWFTVKMQLFWGKKCHSVISNCFWTKESNRQHQVLNYELPVVTTVRTETIAIKLQHQSHFFLSDSYGTLSQPLIVLLFATFPSLKRK